MSIYRRDGWVCMIACMYVCMHHHQPPFVLHGLTAYWILHIHSSYHSYHNIITQMICINVHNNHHQMRIDIPNKTKRSIDDDGIIISISLSHVWFHLIKNGACLFPHAACMVYTHTYIRSIHTYVHTSSRDDVYYVGMYASSGFNHPSVELYKEGATYLPTHLPTYLHTYLHSYVSLLPPTHRAVVIVVQLVQYAIGERRQLLHTYIPTTYHHNIHTYDHHQHHQQQQ